MKQYSCKHQCTHTKSKLMVRLVFTGVKSIYWLGAAYSRSAPRLSPAVLAAASSMALTSSSRNVLL
jgi:hypothetical protein